MHREQSGVGGAPFVKIHVDASGDFRLLDTAKALASALNEEGIAATVLETEIGIARKNTIHILIGPKLANGIGASRAAVGGPRPSWRL
jgi:hypothetical protein